MDAALKGYLAYTNCTSATSEVVPFGGKTPVIFMNAGNSIAMNGEKPIAQINSEVPVKKAS